MALLEVRDVRKSYPGVHALDGVDFDVEPGEVHALLGENGAGKSTLMKVIAGAVRPETGSIAVSGEPLPLGSPRTALAHGVAVVYQDLSLVPALSIAENVALGNWPIGRLGTVSWRRIYDEAGEHLRRVGIDQDVRMPVAELGMAERQLVEIAKALSHNVRVLLLDEPTSALSARESGRLFDIIRELKRSEVAIVYVSHVLEEVLRIADRVTVLRDGRVVDTVPAASVQEGDLARMMVGHEVATQGSIRRSGRAASEADTALRVRGLARPPRLRDVDLELAAGEVVGVFGLVGAGRSRLARSLVGLEPPTRGTVEIGGRSVHVGSPVAAIAAGFGYVGEDRAMGIVPKLSVAANITLATLNSKGRSPLLDFGRERRLAERYVQELAIRTPSIHRAAETLSGGNQQKVLLARWLCSGARVLVLDDPTRGIDVGAKEDVLRLVRRIAADGVAVLYLTSELKEAKAIGDRVLVMAGGRIVTSTTADTSDDQIMAAAAGGSDV
jgi:ABC-type sugar transport system ATPase subunit